MRVDVRVHVALCEVRRNRESVLITEIHHQRDVIQQNARVIGTSYILNE
jgi:hypothetical protein